MILFLGKSKRVWLQEQLCLRAVSFTSPVNADGISFPACIGVVRRFREAYPVKSFENHKHRQ